MLDDLLEQRILANLGTLESDGRIHMVPMWFRRHRNNILLPTSSHSRKARNISRHPYASILMHKAESGIQVWGALLRGPVEVVRGPAALVLNRSIHLRYVKAEGLALPGATPLVSGDDITLSVEMEDVVTWDLRELDFVRAIHEGGDAYPVG